MFLLLLLQELLTLHSGWSPAAAHAADLESVHMLGSRAYELYPAVDCPLDAHYFDAVHYFDSRLLTYKRSACLFEQVCTDWRVRYIVSSCCSRLIIKYFQPQA